MNHIRASHPFYQILWNLLLSGLHVMVFYLIIPYTYAQSDSTDLQMILEELPLEIPPDDSSARALREEEEALLKAGDTLRAFSRYVRWMAYQVNRGNQMEFGTRFDPYHSFARFHPGLVKHSLYQYLYGLQQSYEGSYRNAVRSMMDAEKDITRNHPEFLENLYFEITNNLLRLTDFQGATEYAIKSVDMNLDRGNKAGELAARLLMATCFSNQKRFEEASRQRRRAADLARETGDYGQLIFIFANNAIDERKQGNLEQSFNNYQSALATIDTNTTYNENSLRYFRAFIHANKLTLFNDAGMTDSVILLGPRYIDSLKVYQASQSILDAKIQIGRAFLLESNPEKAKEYLIEARQELAGTGLENFMVDVNKYLAEVYQMTGEHIKANEALTKVVQLQNQIDSVNNAQLINSLQMRYESDRQQALLDKTEQQVRQEVQQRKQNMRLFVTSLIVLSLVTITIILVKNHNQLKREKDIEIRYNQRLIQYQEDENRRISKELHDGIGQSLMLIKNKVQLSHDDQTAQMVGDTLNEVRNISRALHPFTLQKLGLTAALEKLVNDFDENTNLLVDAEIEHIDERFEDNEALNIFRIAQEVLSNILKHSQAKSLEFKVQKKPNYTRLYIRDNGLGFDVTENFNTVSSLGLKTLRERTRLLKGRIDLHSEKGKGTEVNLKIPI